MTRIDLAWKEGHCRGELGRGHIHNCPRSWLRAVAANSTDDNLRAACRMALDNPDLRGDDLRTMRRLAGRRIGNRR